MSVDRNEPCFLSDANHIDHAMSMKSLPILRELCIKYGVPKRGNKSQIISGIGDMLGITRKDK